jgi:hypothetical protein
MPEDDLSLPLWGNNPNQRVQSRQPPSSGEQRRSASFPPTPYWKLHHALESPQQCNSHTYVGKPAKGLPPRRHTKGTDRKAPDNGPAALASQSPAALQLTVGSHQRPPKNSVCRPRRPSPPAIQAMHHGDRVAYKEPPTRKKKHKTHHATTDKTQSSPQGPAPRTHKKRS